MKSIKLLLIGGAFLLLWCPSIHSKEALKVAVASNFYPTLKALVEDFESTFAIEVAMIPGSTGKLYAQILHGAPFDVFLAADEKRPIGLVTQNIVPLAAVDTYAYGQLAVWHPHTQSYTSDYLLAQDVNRIAMANTRTAPYGLATQQYFQSMALMSSIRHKLVVGENVGQALRFSQTGNAQVSFVALSLLLSLDKSRFTVINSQHHTPIKQQLVNLSQTSQSNKFVNFILSPEGREIIQQQGYLLP